MKVILVALGALATMVAIVSVDLVEPSASKTDRSAHSGVRGVEGSQLETHAAPWWRAFGPADRKSRSGAAERAHTQAETEAEAVPEAERSMGRGSGAAERHGSGTAIGSVRPAAVSGAVIVHGAAARENAEASAPQEGAAQANGPTAPNSQSGSTTRSSTSPAHAKTDADKPLNTCSRCESIAHDDNMSCPDSYTNCHSLPGALRSDHPTMPGMSKALLCTQILDCIHQTKCAGPNATGGPTTTDCLCGRDIDPDTCFKGMTVSQTRGLCRDLMVAGTEVEDLEQIAMRFFDHTSATGAAVAVVETCDLFSCARECL